MPDPMSKMLVVCERWESELVRGNTENAKVIVHAVPYLDQIGAIVRATLTADDELQAVETSFPEAPASHRWMWRSRKAGGFVELRPISLLALSGDRS